MILLTCVSDKEIDSLNGTTESGRGFSTMG